MRKSNGVIRDILAVADGQIIGRIRLQKIVYLLEQCGLGVGFDFSYHHYGPYSGEVSTEIERERLLDKSINEIMEPVGGSGGFYSIYKVAEGQNRKSEKVGNLNADQVKYIVDRIKKETSMVAELASTIHWLKERERIDDWRTELKRRKPTKASDENICKALQLLDDLGALNGTSEP